MNRFLPTYLAVLLVVMACNGVEEKKAPPAVANEPFRPLFHFSPAKAWMNDPNGMVWYRGTYHLFYQYFPDSTVWGPMHWGHATSKDLVHWEHQPVALYPDSLGYIFSGSAVVDSANTSGLGREGKVPMVAIFTHHNPEGEKAGSTTFQNQSIAYSLDEGKTWTKYSGNPVLKNPGIRDFRDPKVRWNEEGKKWVMTLATQDRVSFFSSPDLKSWKKESEFGQSAGAHGGVWECPDLFPLVHNGEKIWVLLVSINPGGPNGGSATQYFTGQFDGTRFIPFDTNTRWIDYGPDDYAGVTWSNTGNRTLFMGWMSNWQYAQLVPTKTWRSAMTVPRELQLVKSGNAYLLTSTPVSELSTLAETNTDATGTMRGSFTGPIRLELSATKPTAFQLELSNKRGQQVVIGFDNRTSSYYIDRTASGATAFEKGFAARHKAPRLATAQTQELTLLVDRASVELFADSGRTVMTSIFFPDEEFSSFKLQSPETKNFTSVQFSTLRSTF